MKASYYQQELIMVINTEKYANKLVKYMLMNTTKYKEEAIVSNTFITKMLSPFKDIRYH